MTDSAATFDRLWSALEPIGRSTSGGYRRFAWTRQDAQLREWFAGEAGARGLDVQLDRAGNQWAWWVPQGARGPAVTTGSHLDSVPDGGAFDGPLGVVAAFCALDELRAAGVAPVRPLAVVNFGDEEGARFGVACAGSRVLTGALPAERALALRDADGTALGEVVGVPAGELGPDPELLRGIGVHVELHVEQGRTLAPAGAAVGVGSGIWPHGRWRAELPGTANHAGTTALDDRRDPVLDYARLVLAARDAADRHDALATCGKVRIEPNGVNAIASQVTGWVDARAADEAAVRAVTAELAALTEQAGGTWTEESWTGATGFDAALVRHGAALLGGAPVLGTGAGHDAGILVAAGVPAVMLFVRNPTGVSHSPAEFADRDDCLAGIEALRTLLADYLVSPSLPFALDTARQADR